MLGVVFDLMPKLEKPTRQFIHGVLAQTDPGGNRSLPRAPRSRPCRYFCPCAQAQVTLRALAKEYFPEHHAVADRPHFLALQRRRTVLIIALLAGHRPNSSCDQILRNHTQQILAAGIRQAGLAWRCIDLTTGFLQREDRLYLFPCFTGQNDFNRNFNC